MNPAALTFRTKLIAFLIALLIVGQAINLFTVYNVAYNAIVEQAKGQLARADAIANQHIKNKANELTEAARIAIQDYELRKQLVNGDGMTRQSVLANLADRIKARRAMLVGLDGKIIADTVVARDVMPEPHPFPFPSMLEQPAEGVLSTEIAVFDGAIDRLVVVPVLLPIPAAYVAIALPIDDALAGELRELSAVPLDISFAFDRSGSGFDLVASTLPAEMRVKIKPFLGGVQENRPEVLTIGERKFVTIERSVAVARESAYVTAILQYAIDDALKPYGALLVQLSWILIAVLVLSLLGSFWMAQSVSRPIARLAQAAKSIGAGDYRAKLYVESGDEIGQLANAFNQMSAAIAEREERLSFQAEHDRLTDLPNRRKFERILDEAVKTEGAVAPLVSVALIGVNRLPEINTTLGHELGDKLVRRIAPRLNHHLPDDALLGRIAESVFAVMLPGRNAETAKPIANAIIQSFEEPVRIDDHLAVDASVDIGLALAPDHGQQARLLLQRADVALFAARRGQGSFAVYDPAQDPHKPENLTLMGELRGGIQRGEFQLHYQPKIGLATRRLIGAEALVRWIHPQHGFLPPDRFIPLAEESGAIHRLTLWALSTGIRQLCQWRQDGLDLRVAINLSVRDLANRNLPDLVRAHLDEAKLSGEKLILEITESAIMSDPEISLATLRGLADLGIALSIDDFGTGHSSFAYLRKLPIAELKVDKSFVLNLSRDSADQTIVRTIVDLGHNLDLKVTAEGVEDSEAFELLAKFGCDIGQGYFMSRPLTLEKFETFARESPYAAQAA